MQYTTQVVEKEVEEETVAKADGIHIHDGVTFDEIITDDDFFGE